MSNVFVGDVLYVYFHICPQNIFCISYYVIFQYIKDDEETKKMAKADGGYMFISSLFAALLAFGMEPVTAMGYTSIACLPLFLTILDLSTFDVLCGMGRGAWTFVLIAFFAASAYGMLT